jgi:hypothetical protein
MEVVVFEKPSQDGPLSKHISLVEGKIHSDGSPCRMWRGEAWVYKVPDLTAFADLINALSPQQALCVGVISKSYRLPDGAPLKVVRKAEYRGEKGTVARVKNAFEFPQDAGPVLLDHDRKHMSCEALANLNKPGGFVGALQHVAPGMKGAGYLLRKSTSTGLRNTKTGVTLEGGEGLHLYVLVKDRSDAARAVAVLHDRLTLAGCGWAYVSRGGQILMRSPVDAIASKTPERIAFEGPPVVEPPLAQDREARAASVTEGYALDTRLALPDLSPDERFKVEAIRAGWRKVLEEEARNVRKARTAERLAKVLEKARAQGSMVSESDLQKELDAAFAGQLAPDFELEFDDPALGLVTVATILSDPERYVGETLADPIEGVAYGRCKAMLMRDERHGGWIIHSYVHGGNIYRLAHNKETITTMIQAAQPSDALGKFLDTIDDAILSEGVEEMLIAQCARGACASIPTVRKAVKQRRNARDAERAKAHREAEEAADGRVVMEAPPRDAEIGVVCRVVDDIMSRVEAAEPPMRSRNGRLANILTMPPPGLHLLTAEDANAADSDRKPKGAPPEPIIRELSGAAVAMLIENYIRFRTPTKTGTRYVALPPPFLEGLNALQGESKLPTLSGVQTLPLVVVRPGGSIFVKNKIGLDRASGVVFRIDREILEAIPDPSGVTFADSKAAYDRLANDWLVDVDTTPEGKAVLIAIALSIVERLLFEKERPAFLVTATIAGAGKTTVLHMIASAVLGRLAAAAAWSTTAEERCKSLFSYLLAGVPLILWDNIPRESRLDCDHINASLTSAEFQDRRLNTQTLGIAPATAIQAFTGNVIQVSGDLQSRTFVVRLSASREDPANRDFKHPDPLAWTRENRVAILRDLYTVLLTPRAVPNRLKTRMKDWWRLVGHPIELLAGVDFENLIAESGAANPARAARVFVVGALASLFGVEHEFLAQDVNRALRYSSDLDDDVTDADSTKWDDATASRFHEALVATANPSGKDDRFFHQRHSLTESWIGQRLSAIVDMPIIDDGCTMTLRMRSGAKNNRANVYFVEYDL